MGKITDKYHQPVKPDTKHLDPLFDIKDIPKRAYQLGLIILFTGVILAFYSALIGMYVSSFLISCFCFSILMFMLLKYNEAINDLTVSIISMVCALLIFSACLESLQSDQYLYFFPLLIVVPLLIDLKQVQYRKAFKLISIIISSFIVCIIIGKYIHPLEDFTPTQVGKLALMNRVAALFLTILFAALYTYFEKKYIDELAEQTNNVINAKTQFLATMGHELRTPLNGIIGVVNLLKDEPDVIKKEEYIQILQYCSDHMLQQVNDILDFNKIEAGMLNIHLSKLNINQLILNTGKPFIAMAKEKNLEIKIEVDPEIDILVFVDDLRLVQIINNLFANALKFTNIGFVKLKAVCKKKDQQQITIAFSMQDTGIGIEKDNQEKIFESFWQVYDENTRQLTGTGLGLSICLRLLKLMNSSLSLQSEKGKGSTFSFELTLDCADEYPIIPETTTDAVTDLHNTRILLVEDNKINMMVAKKILTSFKAAVSCTYDGQEALDHLAADANFNIILMDLEMPVMNGYTAIYEIKRLFPHIPVVALTASLVDQQMLADLLASGFNDCMLKPFEPQELLHTIQRHII